MRQSSKIMKHLSDFERGNLMKVLGKILIIDFSHRYEVIDDENTNVVTTGAIVTVTVTLKRNNMSKLFGDPSAKVKDEIREDLEVVTDENGEFVEEPLKEKEKKSMWKSMKPKRGEPGAKNKQKGGSKKVQPQQQVVKQTEVAVAKETKAMEKLKESESEAESGDESEIEEKEDPLT